MKEPNFSFVAIMKNEANTLPRLFQSLKPILDRGVEFVIIDTGSTDSSAVIARALGAIVHEVGDRFMEHIPKETADMINKEFVVDDEPNVVSGGNKLFNYAEARNYVTSLASNNFVFTLDCDEAYSTFDIDYIINLIDIGHTQFEYEFVYAHDPTGKPAVQFIQSKAYDRRYAQWVGKVHEVLQSTGFGESKIYYIPQHYIKLEHWQEPNKEHRGNYLPGLALDCFLHKNNDRNSHYFAREMMYTGRYKSAIKEFTRHIGFNAWVQEKAQSMIFIGYCYGYLGDFAKQVEWYNTAFFNDSSRREALIKLAEAYRKAGNWYAVAAHASGSLQIPFNSYYANDGNMYTFRPYELLYEAQGWIGNIEGAQKSLLKCLEYQPLNPKYLYDTRYFFEYPSSMVDGWMTFEEQTFLYNLAKKYNGGKIAEIGSWKGRSSQALLTGNKDGQVFCIDTWKGSIDERDSTNWMAKQEDVFAQFQENTKNFTNLSIVKLESVKAAEMFEDNYFDVVFVDAGHDYKSICDDIDAWLLKVKKGGVFCGHDYMPDTWQSIIEAVDEELGKPDEVHGTVWVKYV